MGITKLACGITGNRPHKLPHIKFGDFNDANFMEYIESMYYQIGEKLKEGYSYFRCGGALGVDQDFAQAVIDYRDGKLGEPQDIKLEIDIPCKEQAKDWTEEEIARYKTILDNADVVHYVSEKYYKGCMQKRNEYIVDNSDCMLAFWNGVKSGGTWNTIQYAQKVKKKIEITRLDKKKAKIKDAFEFDIPEPDLTRLKKFEPLLEKNRKKKKK